MMDKGLIIGLFLIAILLLILWYSICAMRFNTVMMIAVVILIAGILGTIYIYG